MKVIDLSLTIAEDILYAGFPRSLVYGKPESSTKIWEVASLKENKFSLTISPCAPSISHITMHLSTF